MCALMQRLLRPFCPDHTISCSDRKKPSSIIQQVLITSETLKMSPRHTRSYQVCSEVFQLKFRGDQYMSSLAARDLDGARKHHRFQKWDELFVEQTRGLALDEMTFPPSSSASFPAEHALIRSCASHTSPNSFKVCKLPKTPALSVDAPPKGQGPE
jgi:hypothetical protein